MGAAGYIAPDVSVRVVDDNGTILEPGREGLVLVRTPVSVHGYFEGLAETAAAFRDGYFDTGDIGYITPEKMLVITGRKKEILNLGGDKVSPGIIEETLTAYNGVREALAFSVPSELGVDEVWALIVPLGWLDAEALQKHCREKLPQTQVPVRFINVAELPRTENGKVDRRRLDTMVQGLAGSSG